MTLADSTALPPGGTYDQLTGQTIDVHADGVRWQMMGDGGFNRLNCFRVAVGMKATLFGADASGLGMPFSAGISNHLQVRCQELSRQCRIAGRG